MGEFEELTLLTVAMLYDNSYGVAIQRELAERCGRKVTISTVHATLQRLHQKGYVESRYDGATAERGGRRKHLFRVTKNGEVALSKAKELRENLWQAIPKPAFGWKSK